MNERRVFQAEIREVQAVGRPYKYLEGRAVPYGVWADVGPFMEQHAPRSFAHSTKGGAAKPGLPLLLMHNSEDLGAIVGHAEKWTHEDDGLLGVWKLSDGPNAQRAAQMAEAGDLAGMSVGFMPQRTMPHKVVNDWDPMKGPDHKDWFIRQESRLIEVSLTPVPVFEEAMVNQVRTAFDYEARARWAPPTPKLDHWLNEVRQLHFS